MNRPNRIRNMIRIMGLLFVIMMFMMIPPSIYAAPTNYATLDPWTMGGIITDVTTSESGPVSTSKVWRFEKTGTYSQYHGWQSAYGGVFTCSAGTYWTVSGYYKTSNAAGLTQLSIGGFYTADWSRQYNTTIVESAGTTIIVDGNWHFFYCTFKANEAMTNPFIDGPSWGYSDLPGVLYINGLQWTKTSYPVQDYSSKNYYSNTIPTRVGGYTYDVTFTEPGLVTTSKTWKLIKTGGTSQWQGWRSGYSGLFNCNIGDYWTISGYYKTSNAAGLTKLHLDNFYKSDMSGPCNMTVVDSKTNIVADGKWHYFYCTMRANEALKNAVIHDGPSFDYSTSAGTIYINDLRWTKHAPYISLANCATFSPSINGGSVQDVSGTSEAGPINGSKTWKFTKTGTGQWQGWYGSYNGTFNCNPGECWTISGFYKTDSPAGIFNLTVGNFLKPDAMSYYNTTVLNADTTITADNQWRYFFCVIRANEAMIDPIVCYGPCWNYSLTVPTGVLYINGLEWKKANAPFRPHQTSTGQPQSQAVNALQNSQSDSYQPQSPSGDGPNFDIPPPNYAEALQKAIFFYECQRSGALPANKRMNWRADSGLNDGSDKGIDLTGGWYDSGDHVKFGLPIAYTAAMLSWSVVEDRTALSNSGQLNYLLDNIKWGTDYLLKCYRSSTNEFYYQVGSGIYDHSHWSPPEVLDVMFPSPYRPSYKVDTSSPGSSVVYETAAALAAASLAFKATDANYATTCLSNAKSLYTLAKTMGSDSGYCSNYEAQGYYPIYPVPAPGVQETGYYPYQVWADAWLYLADNNNATYSIDAQALFPSLPKKKDANGADTSTIFYAWGHGWQLNQFGAALLLARATNQQVFKDVIQNNLDYWTTGVGSNPAATDRVTYTNDGLAWLNQWDTLGYVSTSAFLASIYANWTGCDATRATAYKSFAKNQIDYILGNNSFQRSFVVGYGSNPPQHIHHRGSHGSWADTLQIPTYNRHTLYGALVSGPSYGYVNGQGVMFFQDDINNYIENIPYLFQNAGFVGALTEMYRQNGGTPIGNFTSVETKAIDEFFVEAQIVASDASGKTLDAYLNNMTGWPPRVTDKLSFRYFFNASGLNNPADLQVTITGGETTVPVSTPVQWSGSIYYITFNFSGIKIYPGGLLNYRKEVKFQFSGSGSWGPQSDYSYVGLNSSALTKTSQITVYDNGTLVYGTEPPR